jgi:predicted PP-loop superfamily ATPase
VFSFGHDKREKPTQDGVVAELPASVRLRCGWCHYMFTRFRQNKSRLQVSLLETRRIDGKGQTRGSKGTPRVDEPAMLEMSKSEVRRCLAVAELSEPEGGFKELMNEIHRARERSKDATIARLLRKKRSNPR